MEQQQQIEIGQRIRELREASPHTNESIADYVGVGTRSVANWIAGTTGITYEHARKVAELFQVDVRWLWDGKERPAGTPDLMGALSERGKIERLEAQLEALRTELLGELAVVRSALGVPQQSQGHAGRKGGGRGK